MRENITTLPTEVIYEIVSYFSYNDIAALAQTSKRLWQVAGSRLHSVIPLLAPEKIRRYIQYLADNPQRATQTLEIHLPKLMPREERRKPSPWSFDSVHGFLITTLERVVPLPFVPVETYPELGRVFKDALRNMTHLRTLAVHSHQHGEIWDNHVIIPSLREIFVYPGAESPSLWLWTTQQDSLTTLWNCWQGAQWWPWWPPSPPACGSTVFPKLRTLITNPTGVAELLPKSTVSDLTIHGLQQPSNLNVHPVLTRRSHPADDTPSFLPKIVRSNKRTPLRRITLAGTLDRICYILRVLQLRDSLPPHVRLFFELENGNSERDLVRPSPWYNYT
jgi:hypothetical protein